MKRTALLTILGLACVFSVFGGGKKDSRIESPVDSRLDSLPEGCPEAIKNAVMKAPKDALVGIGVAKQASEFMSIRTAELRALVAISRQINNVVYEFAGDNGEHIVMQISKANVSGAKRTERITDADDSVWVVFVMEKPVAFQEISKAQEETDAVFSEEQINTAIAKIAAQDIQVVSQ